MLQGVWDVLALSLALFAERRLHPPIGQVLHQIIEELPRFLLCILQLDLESPVLHLILHLRDHAVPHLTLCTFGLHPLFLHFNYTLDVIVAALVDFLQHLGRLVVELCRIWSEFVHLIFDAFVELVFSLPLFGKKFEGFVKLLQVANLSLIHI